MAGSSRTGVFLVILGVGLLAGCQEAGKFPFASRNSTADKAPVPGGEAAADVVEKDVEAPDVFAANEQGLWDGRPSLGGVWVAHPEVADPERVIIRNEANGNFVIGALFRRERENPGPRIQVSSDAAAELGMLAGQPSTLDVVALRRETVEVPVEASPEALAAPDLDADGAAAGTAVASIEASALDPVATAGAAIDAAEDLAPPPPSASLESEAEIASADPAGAADLSDPYVQIGIFSVAKNAENTATSLRGAGLLPTVREQEARGKKFWRVVVGPATSRSERQTILAKVRDMGFTDAYYVSN